jgi:L-lactate dehydrogenase complex protein LldF
MDVKCEAFSLLSELGLQDGHLQEALKLIGTRLQEMRNRAFSELENGDALREKAHRIREETLDRLDEHLQTMEATVIENGGVVHCAKHADEAGILICKLARER